MFRRSRRKTWIVLPQAFIIQSMKSWEHIPWNWIGDEGTYFAVWAPNVMRVSVVGDFNEWDGRIHQMRRLGDSGIFELFIPGQKSETVTNTS